MEEMQSGWEWLRRSFRLPSTTITVPVTRDTIRCCQRPEVSYPRAHAALLCPKMPPGLPHDHWRHQDQPAHGVLDRHDEPIHGLYAAGSDTGGGKEIPTVWTFGQHVCLCHQFRTHRRRNALKYALGNDAKQQKWEAPNQEPTSGRVQ